MSLSDDLPNANIPGSPARRLKYSAYNFVAATGLVSTRNHAGRCYLLLVVGNARWEATGAGGVFDDACCRDSPVSVSPRGSGKHWIRPERAHSRGRDSVVDCRPNNTPADADRLLAARYGVMSIGLGASWFVVVTCSG